MRHAAPTLALALAAVLGPAALPGCGQTESPPEHPTPPEAVAEDTADQTHEPEPESEADPETEATDGSPRDPVADDPSPIDGTPPRFTDHAPQYRHGRDDRGQAELIPVEPVPFDMILIPGDAEQGIAPFYLGETEVTWGMMVTWMYCRDILDRFEIERLIVAGLRPSPLYGDAAVRLYADEHDYPAAGVTRHTAEKFCLWLSEKTGRRYRLPTPEEFALAIHEGGGFPEDPEALLALGGFRENSLFDDPFFGPADPDDPWAEEYLRVAEVKSRDPDGLGVYDLLGNAGEWVVEPGGEAYLMGGHFAVPVAAMSADWSDAEDDAVWNSVYPIEPRMRFWYWGQHHFQGFRLVCEVGR